MDDQLPAVIGPSAPPAIGELRELVDRAKAFAGAARATNTTRAYESAWRAFTTWCDARGFGALPASADIVALYLTARVVDLKVNTLELHRAAIDAAHRAHDHEPPKSARLSETWDGIRRKLGAPPAKKKALRLPELKKILRALPADIVGVRDRAILLIWFAGAFRRGELAQLSLDETAVVRCSFVDEGLRIDIARSKGDQHGAGATLAIPPGRNAATCPVRALRAWLDLARIESGPVFRPIDRFGRLGSSQICDRTLVRILKARAACAGLNADLYSGHSPRRGMISDAAAAGVSPDAIQAHARHARWDTTRGYIEDAQRFDRSAAGKVGL